MLGESSYQTLFETAPPDSLYGKLWKTKFEDKERWLYDMICPSCGFDIFCKYFPSMESLLSTIQEPSQLTHIQPAHFTF